MAPGGFTARAMREHPDGKFYGITLPEAVGGHKVLTSSFPAGSRLEGCKYIDVTMLRELAAGKHIPKTHPEHLHFRIEKPYTSHKFALVFCDGMVLRSKLRMMI